MRPSVPDIYHAVGVVRGTNAGIAAASTVNVSDSSDPDHDIEAHAIVFTGTSVSEGIEGQALVDITTGVKSLYNNSGADVSVGDVVVNDPTRDDAFTTTTTAQFTAGAIGIAQANIPAGGIGPVLFSGYASIVNVTAAVTRGTFLETSTTARKATTNASRRAGSFGVVLTGADPAANVTNSATVLGSATSTLTTAGTSMTITVPLIDNGFGGTSVPGDGLVMVLMLQRTVSTTPTITGWTRIGATAGFYYYYRVTSSEPASYSATWTTSSQAVALVLVVDGLATASLVAGSAFDSTTSAATISGLVSAAYWAVAGVDAIASVSAPWQALASEVISATGPPGNVALTGTVTNDPRNANNWTNPTNVNDGNLSTVATIGIVGGFEGLVNTLAGASTLTSTSFFVFDGGCDHPPYIEYWDGAAWQTAAGTWSGGRDGLGCGYNNPSPPTFTFTTPIATTKLACHWINGTFKNFQEWQINGVASVSVAAELVGQTFSGTSVTSPFTGASAQNDGLIAFNLRSQTTFVTSQLPDAIIWEPDLGAGTSLTVQDEGTPLATIADTLNFVGAGVTASGSGATKTITIPGGSGWFNVKNYGATGDGTTNDLTACQAAVTAAAAAGGGVVYFPAGSYALGSPGLAVGEGVALVGDGREFTKILAGANSINVVTVTGTATDSSMEVAHAQRFEGIEFGANAKTGCEGLVFVGVAYFNVSRCTFRGFVIGSEYYGSLQGRFDDCKFLSNGTGIKYDAQTIGYYGGILPPSRVLVNWCTFYFNTTYAIDWSGGQQVIICDTELGQNGTAANSATGCIKVRMGGDSHGFGLVAKGLWVESNHGNAAIDLGGTVVGEHSLVDCWLAYTDATYSISLDGSSAAQTLVARNVRHDAVVSPATVSTWRSAGGTTYLNAIECDGSTSGTWTAVRAEPLLSGQLVSDYSQWLALRLPNLTTTQQNAIASPTAGMTIWNTTTQTVRRYDGSAWADVGGGGSVTSVALTVPAEFSVAGSPITSSGTLAVTKANENANTVWAGPTSGSAAAPTFRSLVAGDIPAGVGGSDHEHVMDCLYSGDGATTVWTLPAAPFDQYSVAAYVAGTLTEVTLSGVDWSIATFGVAPVSGTNNIRFDIVAAVA